MENSDNPIILVDSDNSFIHVGSDWEPPDGELLPGNSYVSRVKEQGLVFKEVSKREALAAREFQVLQFEGVVPVYSIYMREPTLEQLDKLYHGYSMIKFDILAKIQKIEHALTLEENKNNNAKLERLNCALDMQRGVLGRLEQEYSQRKEASYFISMPDQGKDLLDQAQEMINQGRLSGPSAKETFNALLPIVESLMNRGVFFTDMKKENVTGDIEKFKLIVIDVLSSVMPGHLCGAKVRVDEIPFANTYQTDAIKGLKAHGKMPLESDKVRELLKKHMYEATARTAVSLFLLTDAHTFDGASELEVANLMNSALSPLDCNAPVPKRARLVSTEPLHLVDENSSLTTIN